MKGKNKKIGMSYESEANVLRVELGRAPIEYASEIGNIVVHFNRKGTPVYVEILEAERFLKQASTLLNTPRPKTLAAVS